MASPKKSKKTSSSLAERKKADLANKILNDRTVTLVLEFVHHHFPEAVPASGLMDGWAREAAGAAINILSYSSGQATGANDLEALYSFLTENHNYLKAGAEVTYEFGYTALGSAQANSPDYRYASLGFKHFGPAWKQSGAGLGTSDHGILDLMSFFRDPKMPPTEGAMAAMDTGGLTAYDRALWYSGGETTSLENFKLVLSGQGAGDVLNKLASYVALDWVLSRVFAAVFIELEIGINNGSSWFGDAYNNSGGRGQGWNQDRGTGSAVHDATLGLEAGGTPEGFFAAMLGTAVRVPFEAGTTYAGSYTVGGWAAPAGSYSAPTGFPEMISQWATSESTFLQDLTGTEVTSAVSTGDVSMDDPNLTKVLKAVETIRINSQCILLQRPEIIFSRKANCYPRHAVDRSPANLQPGTPSTLDADFDADDYERRVAQATYNAQIAGMSTEVGHVGADGEAASIAAWSDPNTPLATIASDGSSILQCQSNPDDQPINYTAVDVSEPGQATIFMNSLAANRKAMGLDYYSKNVLSTCFKPFVRFYIMLHSEDPSNPIVEIPLNFESDSVFDKYRAAATDQERAEEARGIRKIGMSSFSAQFLGTNPAESESYLKVDAEFSMLGFTSMTLNESTVIRNGQVYTAKFIDLITRRSRSASKTSGDEKLQVNALGPGIASLDPRVVQDSQAKITQDLWDPKNFQVRVEFGLNSPSVSSELISSTVPSEDYKNAPHLYEQGWMQDLADQNTASAYLTLSNHDITIEDNGIIKLKVEYIGYIESILRSVHADLMHVDTKNNALAIEHAKAFDNLVADRKAISETAATSTSDEDLQSQIASKEAEVKRTREELTKFKHNRIVSMLVEQGKIYKVAIDADVLGLSVRAKKATRSGAAGEEVVFSGPRANLSHAGVLNPEIAQTDAPDFNMTFDKQGSREAAAKEIRMGTGQISSVVSGVVSYEFMYFYLGDLIDVALDIIKSGNASGYMNVGTSNRDEIRVVVGPFEYFDPSELTERVINLADIPISLDLFYSWFIKRVVRTGRNHYNFAQFIKDLVFDLVSTIMRENCMTVSRDYALQKQPNLRDPKFSVAIVNPHETKLPPGRRMMMPYHGMAGFKPGTISEATYYVLYATAMVPKMLASEPKSDASFGIAHLDLGKRDRGILQSAKFKKTDVPYLGEARVLQDSISVGQFREKYDADITLLGNNIFRPGQYVYLETANLVGEPATQERTFSRSFGFGGYYLINTVTHTFEFSTVTNYSTTLQTVWQTAGLGLPVEG